MLAKWLSRKPRVMIVDEPTRGIDVGTKAEVHRLLQSLATEGVAVLVISSELPEVLLLADRILVIREGRLVEEISRRRCDRGERDRCGRRCLHGEGGMTATDTEVVTHAAPAAREHRLAATIARFRPAVLAAVILVIFGLTTIRNSDFASASSIQAILSIASIYMLLAVGEAMVIITRNVDLSIGSTLGLSAFTVGELFTHDPHTSIVLAFVVGIGVGAGCGAVIGPITTLLRVPSLVVTLAALYIIRGFDEHHRHRRTDRAERLPTRPISLGYSTIAGIPWLFVIVAVIAIVAASGCTRSRQDVSCTRSDPIPAPRGWPASPARCACSRCS